MAWYALEMQDTVTLVLSSDEALIILDLLADFRDQTAIAVKDSGDRAALWSLVAVLEKELSEPILPGYESRLSEAKRRLSEHYGLPNN